MNRWMKLVVPVALGAGLSIGWNHLSGGGSAAMAQVAALAAPPAITAAIAVISPTADNKTAGWVKFTAVETGVIVVADVTGLTPGKHGFHIHQWGDISDAAKGMATGGHYDPAGTHHHELVDAAHPDGTPHHAGDMGNLDADADGHAHLEETILGVSIMGPLNPIVGRAVIVHAGADDGGQPTGNAGGRVGQGVIGIANPAPAPAK